jgi:uncharacterized RDD family membrane protein YckC
MEVSRTTLLIRRIGAYLIDIALGLCTGLWLVQQESLALKGMELIFVYCFLYSLCEWLLHGRPPGKHVFGQAVINGAGGRPTLLQCLICGPTRDLEASLGIVAAYIYAKSARCQRVGDMLARTYVMPARDLVRLRAAVQEGC